MQVSKNIFRNYDIRGIYPTEINEELSYHVGKALGSLLVKKNKTKVVVGRDDRESSYPLARSMIKGFVETGCDVVDVGVTITPVIHFLTRTEDFDLGVEVTASHNPKEYNGFRIDYKNAKSFYGDLVLMLRFMIEREGYSYGNGSLREEELSAKYIDYLVARFKLNRRIKAVIDCGSGATSVIAPKIFEQINCESVPIQCNYDSNFPHGIPDPENRLFMEELKGQVLINKADVGFAFDTGIGKGLGVSVAGDRRQGSPVGSSQVILILDLVLRAGLALE